MPEHDESARLRQAAKRYVWPTFGKDISFFDEPASVIVSAQGSYVTDAAGARYVDGWSGACAATLGHNHPHVIAAMRRQMDALVQNPTGWPASPPQIQLAEKIASLTPESLQYTIFSTNGTDANETAIKIARQYWKLRGKAGKHKVIGRARNYHGMSLATLAAGGNLRRRKYQEPLPPGFAHISTPDCYRCRYPEEHPDCGPHYADELRQAIAFEDADTVACVMMEQTLGGGGCLVPPKGYVEEIRRICDEHEVLLVLDEVITGFGRTGTWFEFQQYGVTPDMVTMAKGMTGGHAPLAATHVRREIAETFFGEPSRHFHHGYTYGGMAVSCAAGVAAIEVVEETRLLERLPARSAAVRRELEAIGAQSPVAGEVRAHGMLFAVEMVEDKATKRNWTAAERDAIARLAGVTAKEHGVILAPFHQFGCVYINIAPALNAEDAALEQIFAAVRASLLSVARNHLRI